MCELVSFFPGLGPGDYWQLTGYELRALQEWRSEALTAEARAQRRALDEALAGR